MAKKLFRIRMRRPANNMEVTTFTWRAATREEAEAMTRKIWGDDIVILPPVQRRAS